ncbi:CLUMA_CG019451, isoform A [Clunio marinus]|uniref:CLUMA_CG019451, isoform A n=1 Tax=Clunio marinus TaxID=568069 RepID=A0A1J1J6G0_9DIPT|nr:CLUMA_CG019451, isoform A [Clunio marinus]
MNKKIFGCFIFLIIVIIDDVKGHGMVMDPVNRASRWKVDPTAIPDYNDMEGFCGGYQFQWSPAIQGRCGLCGDRYTDALPRAHELGGTYGQGVIVKSYEKGSSISVTVRITANHRGYFYFRICNLDHEQESDECFERYKLSTTTGSSTYTLPSTAAADYFVSLKLPTGLTCKHCVLQWTYVAGNNWGYCDDGSGRLGCGPQEHFRTCSDIQITE